MRQRPTRRAALVHGTIAALATSAALAGPVWDESSLGDAGSGPAGAQQTDGSGEVTLIKGELEGNAAATSVAAGPGDFEDMYVIRICDPMAFLASTVMADGGAASFNTQLWLFRPGTMDPLLAFGVLGNDDTAVPLSPQSRLLPDATDGSPSLTMPGLYYLAVTGLDNDPVSAGGLIFLQSSPVEISGPDGPGGGAPLTSWNQEPPLAVGAYEITLDAVTYATQTTIDCNQNGVHDMCDIALATSSDVNMNQVPDECDADIDDDGDVDVQDLLLLLGAWGPCPVPPTPCPADFNGDGIVGVTDLLFLLAQWT